MSVLFTCDPVAPHEATIFHERWWLECATGGAFDTVQLTENGQIVASLPYCLGSGFGFKAIVMPKLVHFMGPYISEGEGNELTRFRRRLSLTRELIGKLPDVSSCAFKFHSAIVDTVPFQMEGFQTSVQFTHIIEPQPASMVWDRMLSQRRTIIRGAEKSHSIEVWDDADRFMDFYNDNLKKFGVKSYFNDGAARRLVREALKRKRGMIWVAKAGNQPSAAIFCVWDRTTAYYLMTTRTPESHGGAVSLLIYEAIKAAMASGLVMDMDGLNASSSVRFLAGFGGKLVPRYFVTRRTKLFRFLHLLRSTIVGENTFTL